MDDDEAVRPDGRIATVSTGRILLPVTITPAGDGLDVASLTRDLARAGCVAADDEARELVAVASDDDELRRMRDRRLEGEPLAWVTGVTRFCGIDITMEPGVFVPRWQSEALARRAALLLPDRGVAVDIGTGSGAIATVLRTARPRARVEATELDPVAVHCAQANGVVVHQGDLDLPLPIDLTGQVDVMTAILPYVPTHALYLLPRDVRLFEPRLALDGGDGGLDLLTRAVRRSSLWVRPGGWLLVEVGDDQIAEVDGLLRASGYSDVSTIDDADGDRRGLCARLGSVSAQAV